jgi:hypothetical protein
MSLRSAIFWALGPLALSLLCTTPVRAEDLRGWIGAGGRNAVGLPGHLDPDFGVEAMGGMWVFNEHAMGLGRLGWSRGKGEGITVDAARIGVGAAAGAAFLEDRLWVGGAVVAGAALGWGRGSGLPVTFNWAKEITITGLVLGRFWRWMVLGVELGPDIYTPDLQFKGRQGTFTWGTLRFNGGLRIGILLGAPVP